MKNKNFNSNTFTKKWFYIAIACAVFFAMVTVFIAICRNMDYKKNSSALEKDVINTETKKDDVKKSTHSIYTSSSSSSSKDKYTTLPKNTLDKKSNENNEKSKNKPEELNVEEDLYEKPKKEKDKYEDEDSINTTSDVKNIPKKDIKKTKLKFSRPAQGKILKEHSQDELVHWSVLNDWRTHDGVDIEAKKNTPIKAAADGVVTDISNEEGTWGNCVVITHKDGFKTIYKGLSDQLQVKLDQTVKAGDVIGAAGSDNVVESDIKNHLHFGIKKDDNWVNPADYIDFEN